MAAGGGARLAERFRDRGRVRLLLCLCPILVEADAEQKLLGWDNR